MIKEDDNSDKLLYSKLEDKIKLSKSKNKILYGGFKNSERKICIVYPEKFTENMIEKNYKNIFSVIRITLPNENKDKYTHKDYLGGIMKLGIDRSRIR